MIKTKQKRKLKGERRLLKLFNFRRHGSAFRLAAAQSLGDLSDSASLEGSVFLRKSIKLTNRKLSAVESVSVSRRWRTLNAQSDTVASSLTRFSTVCLCVSVYVCFYSHLATLQANGMKIRDIGERKYTKNVDTWWFMPTQWRDFSSCLTLSSFFSPTLFLLF